VRQSKGLVKRWHPDRYAADPQGQAEAAQRMREINAAFALVRQAFRGTRDARRHEAQSPPPSSKPSPPPTGRLTEADLKAIEEAMAVERGRG
jgi:hypothetical protein